MLNYKTIFEDRIRKEKQDDPIRFQNNKPYVL